MKEESKFSIIRDATLTTTNDFQIFGESFANLSKVTLTATQAMRALVSAWQYSGEPPRTIGLGKIMGRE